MPFYIILRDDEILSKIIDEQKTIPLKLKKNLFISNKINKDFCENLGENESLIILKTSRNVERAKIDCENGIYSLGSLTLVAYEPLKDISGNRTIYRLINRAPCFKASSLIYLFPYINYDKYIGSRIVSPNILIKKIIMYGGKVISASRLKLIYPRCGRIFIEDLTRSLMKRTEKINMMLQDLNKYDKSKRIKHLREIKTEIKTLRELIKVYNIELSIDLKTIRSKLINITKIVNQMINETMEDM